MCYFCSNIPLDKEMDSDLKVKLESEIYICLLYTSDAADE